MEPLLFVVIVLFIIMLIVIKWLHAQSNRCEYNAPLTILEENNSSHFKKKDFLLNVPERKFFEWLQNIIPSGYVVFPQIVLSNIVQVSSAREYFWTYQNKINRKTIDFVIFETQYLKPVIAIEYDWKTHERADRKKRDKFVDEVVSSVWMKIIHIKHQTNVDLRSLKREIDQSLDLK